MFSSNPLPQVPSSTNVFSPPNSFFDYEKDNVHFNYHQRIDNPSVSGDFVLHAYNCPAPPPVTENVTTFKQDFVIQQPFSEGSELQYCEHHDDLLDSVISSHGSHKKKMATSKKDGHSKIYTARGPRDRRVRLSIDIARKFFCLQDLLGFDKASKTLDWLLTKSLTSIKDLVEETNQCSSSSVTDESKVKFLETIKGDSDEENGQKKKSVLKGVDRKKKKTTRRSKAGSQENLSRDQSRAEARARARERTKEKLRVKRFDEFESGCCGQIEQQNVYKDIGWECIMDGETSNLSKDSSFQIGAFHEQLGDHAVNDLDL